MNKFIWATSLCLIFMVSSANADDGLSFGASYGYANIDDSDQNFSFDASDTGYKLFGRYMFNNGFGIEGSYIDFGEPDDDFLGQVARDRCRSLDPVWRGRTWPVRQFSICLRRLVWSLGRRIHCSMAYR